MTEDQDEFGYKMSSKDVIDRLKSSNTEEDNEFEDILAGRAQAEDAGEEVAEHPEELNQLLTPEDELDLLKLREAHVARQRELRALRARVRRLEAENLLESKFEPVTLRIRAIPYTNSVAKALTKAGSRTFKLATTSRSERLRHKYGIKSSKPKS